ncbi:DUF4367 domain-containing protein [Bacillus paranthracis]|uniref:DUF4367 domain-containing protein n=1 Tax=Bacillus paranthracis TaxID=2026186 RepID=UPI000B438F3C|nr:DUF4367 domain-containing protein [Bacillus paranthracis]MDA1586652.1 DUF4367 domain-containing protein [Bacillus cereus group sp. TH230-1LC]MRC73274.1 DUF4367 domain-containing protein [Bacillus thuringiensis]OTX76521.1 hypothetical protein BK722_03620 [Bacillus thuringiensis serovar finitimus]MCR6796192.1 DUF4367 domain-containing protein [Bacillus paranthracis]MEC3359482.1 DUF4367 domain-containing protein [Bacillus paranthracis]
MNFPMRLLVTFVFISTIPTTVQAQEIKYNHNSITLAEINSKVRFKVYAPQQIPNNWTLEIKTYPWGEKEDITYFRLHYMDSKDEHLLVGIEQRKETSNQEEVHPHAKQVDINGYKGYFEEWGNNGELDKKGELVTGGLLRWTQNGTYIQMHSSRVPKDKMLEIARSMTSIQ